MNAGETRFGHRFPQIRLLELGGSLASRLRYGHFISSSRRTFNMKLQELGKLIRSDRSDRSVNRSQVVALLNLVGAFSL